MGKLTSFGVDMFFLKLLESKNGENGLILVLTCFFSNSWNPKNGKYVWWENMELHKATGVLGTKWNPIGNWAAHKMWGNDWKSFTPTYIHTYIYIYICNTYTYIYMYIYIYIHIKIYTYVFLKLLESKNGENWLVLVLTCFFSNSWNPKNGKID